jgi:nicotinamidase-related amidase
MTLAARTDKVITVDPDRTALVVIDVQNGFVTDNSRHVVPVIADLTRRWLAAGRPLVLTRYLNHPGSMFERLLHWTELAAPPATDLVPELRDAADHATVLDKKGYTFLTDEGRALVAANGWTDLVYCGIDTESCVLKSAVDTFEAGIRPWILTDACASHTDQAGHDAGLLLARRFIGASQLLTVEDALTAFG